MPASQPLHGKVALVAGASRGAGRGIACALGEAGATVYCTGRTAPGRPSSAGRPETVEETAEMVAARGGVAVALHVDHTDGEQVRALVHRIAAEQGRLDVLVNNVNGDDLVVWGKPLWEQSLERGLAVVERGIASHIRTAHAALPLMIRSGPGLVVGMTDKGVVSFFHGLEKQTVMRMAELLAPELRRHGITAVAVTPGYLRSEAILEKFGVTEQTWREAVKRDPYFAGSETPFYVGRAVAALAADPGAIAKSGQLLASWELAEEYGFTDVDGARPHWDRFLAPALDERWAALAERVRAECRKRGLDPAAVEDDRPTLTLRAPLPSDGGPRWFRQPISMEEVFYANHKQIAAGFCDRYAAAR